MANFAFVPHHCTPKRKDYNVVRTDMEGMRIKTRLKSTNPIREWELEFRVQNNTERAALLSHYDGEYGILTPFNWTSVPDYISAETSIYVRYKVYSEELVVNNVWEITIEFEESL
jgi:hypothetical protein